MYINPAQYAQVFGDIKRTSSSHSTCKLILFVSCLSIDSICTAKILSLVLKKSLVQYQLIPVVGYFDLKEQYLRLDAEVANVILVGCGAMIDIEAFFEIEPSEYVQAPHEEPGAWEDLDRPAPLPTYRRKIYVMDGSRPWNLDNVFGLEMVVCFDDGYIDRNLAKERDAYAELTQAESGDEGSESELSEEEEEEEPEVAEVEVAEVEVEEVEEADAGAGKRKLQDDPRAARKQRRRHLRACEDVVETYYNQGTAVFTATTAVVYALLATIGETNTEHLWLAIIGAAALDRLQPDVYDKIQPLFAEEVYRLNPAGAGADSERLADSTWLTVDKDYHLFLLRHWTLYDAFFYLSLVNSKLNLWTDDGRKKLHKLFAKMGISLVVAQQKWLYMDIGVKKNLPVIFNKYLPLYGLEGVVRDGFVRTFGYMGQLSAMECVEALAALLEGDPHAPDRRPDLAADQDEINARIDRKEKLWVNNFWYSWDALNMSTHGAASRLVSSTLALAVGNVRKLKGYDLLVHGLDMAKAMQQTIFRTGMSVLERKVVKNLRLYRLCVLHDGSIPDLAVFSNPMILAKLGNWLLENITELEFLNYKDDGKLGLLKPLVVASLDVASDTYLVIGLAPRYPRGLDNSAKAKLMQKAGNAQDAAAFTTRLNTFSVAFQKVAASSGAKVRINSFDSSIIEIRRDDLSPFLEKLTLSGLI